MIVEVPPPGLAIVISSPSCVTINRPLMSSRRWRSERAHHPGFQLDLRNSGRRSSRPVPDRAWPAPLRLPGASRGWVVSGRGTGHRPAAHNPSGAARSCGGWPAGGCPMVAGPAVAGQSTGPVPPIPASHCRERIAIAFHLACPAVENRAMKKEMYTNPTMPPTTTMIAGSMMTLNRRMATCSCDS